MIRARPAVVNPHSLPVLPAAVVTRVFTRARIIYDTHELESETMGASAVRRRVGRLLERAFVPMCAAIVVVNNSIGEWYRQRHPRARVVVVRNVPPRTFVPDAPSTRLRDLCGVPVDHLLFLYQGTIGEGRAVGLVLDVFERAAPDRHVVFLGYGELEDDVRRVAASHSNVHFLPGVAPSDLLDYTSSADVGLCLIENRCLSYYLSLPNKLFEYIVAGVPVIVSAFPEMTEIVESTGSGWAIPVRADDLERLVGSLDRPEVERRAAAAADGGRIPDVGDRGVAADRPLPGRRSFLTPIPNPYLLGIVRPTPQWMTRGDRCVSAAACDACAAHGQRRSGEDAAFREAEVPR